MKVILYFTWLSQDNILPKNPLKDINKNTTKQILFLQMKKLYHGKVQELFQDDKAGKEQS